MSLLTLYLLFAKYGVCAFGGGYVLIPLFIHDLVEKYAIITRAEFGNLLAIAQMTPGPIGINTATYIGYLTHGVIGGIAATLGLLTPAVFLVITAAYCFRKWESTRWMQGLLSGMRPATLGLIIAAVLLFADIAIFTVPLPVHRIAEWFGAAPQTVPAGEFGIRWVAVGIAAGVALVSARWKVNIFYLIIGAALAGMIFLS